MCTFNSVCFFAFNRVYSDHRGIITLKWLLFVGRLDVPDLPMLCYLSVTCCECFLDMVHPSPWYLYALSCWASHPAVSAFVLSWKQQCDRSWVGVRDELWGNGQVFTAEGEKRV